MLTADGIVDIKDVIANLPSGLTDERLHTLGMYFVTKYLLVNLDSVLVWYRDSCLVDYGYDVGLSKWDG